MLDALADLIPFLRNSLLNDREKRIVAAAILISLPLTMFFVSFKLSFIILENRYAQIKEDDKNHIEQITPISPARYNAVEMAALHSFLLQTYETGNMNSAEEIARLIIRRSPDDDFAHFMMAKIHIQREQFAQASRIFRELEMRDFIPDSLRTLRIMMATNEDLSQLVAEANSFSVEQLAIAGQRFMDLENNAAARTFLDRAFLRDSANADALFVAANWYIGQKEFSTAERLIKKALEIDPASSRIRGRYAILLHETGRIKEAVDNYVAALRRNPLDHDLMYRLGDLFFTELNDRNNARRYFERVIELAPNMWEAYFKMGMISMQENNVPTAIEFFLTADRFSHNNLRILHLLAAAYERNNDTENALEIYARILNINPLDDIALYKRRLLGRR